MSDDDDDWSYSFPPSRDSFSQQEIKNLESIDAVNNLLETSLLQSQAARRIQNSGSVDSRITIPDDAVLNSLSDSFAGSATLLMSAKNGSSSGQSGLSAPFNPKSAPANPQTTIKDANSIISKESTNALASSDTYDPSPPMTPASDFRNSIRIWQQQQQQLGPEDLNRRNDDDNPASPLFQEQFASPSSQDPQDAGDSSSHAGDPKVIAYRKGSNRRKQSASYHALEHEENFDSRLYVEEKFKDTSYHYTTMQRNVEFHQIFKSLDLTDRLIDDFACALSREILLQGRIYITEHCVGFNSNLLGWVTSVVIPFEEITRIDKKSTAGLFPNGIQIETADSKNTFASFISRDSTFDLIRTVWSASTGKDVAELNLVPQTKTVGANQQISDYILSIDEDAHQEEPLAPVEAVPHKEDEPGDSADITEEMASATVRRIKKDSPYRNPGPDFHPPTLITGTYEDSSDETEVINENIDCPMGFLFELLFGRENLDFHRRVLEDQGATEVSEYGDFEASEPDSKLERSYSYRRPLGYSLGPKSTKCFVSELIEHSDFNSSVVVLSTTVTPDVPSGGSFSVRTRYYLSWGDNSTTNLRIAYYLKWTGRSWIKNVIEKSTLAAQTSVNRSTVDSLKQEVESNMELVEVSSEELKEVAPLVEKKDEEVLKQSKPPVVKANSVVSAPSPKASAWGGIGLGVGLLLICLMLYLQVRLAGALFETRTLLSKQLELISNLSELLVENEQAPWWNKMFAEDKDSRRRERAIFLAKQALLLLEGSQEKSLRATLEEIL